MTLHPHSGFGTIPETINTERLQLRRTTLADVDLIFEYGADPEVTRWMDWPTHKSIHTVIEYLQTCDALWESGEEYTWMITLKDTRQPIGGISLRIRAHMADFGYVMNRRHWGQGLATESARAIVTLASSIESVQRLWATCDTENTASARVLEKVGLSREGTLRRWAVRPNISRQPRDAYVYSKICNLVEALP